jgi:hypothetical protein
MRCRLSDFLEAHTLPALAPRPGQGRVDKPLSLTLSLEETYRVPRLFRLARGCAVPLTVARLNPC